MDRRPGGIASPPNDTSHLGNRPGWRWPWDWRWFATAAVGILTLLAAIGLSRLRIDDDLRSLLRDADADFRLVDEVAARFGASDRDCIVRATARSGDLFDETSLLALRRVTDRLARTAGVEQVRSMFDVRRQGAAGAVLPVIPHVEGPLTEEDRQAAKARAIAHPLVFGHLLSADASATLLVARLEASANKPPRLGEVVTRLETLLAEEAAESPALSMELTGLPALREQAGRGLRHDMLLFNSIGLGLAIAISACVARSLRSTIVACVPPFVGAVWAMGILGLCGAPINMLTSVVPSLALVVGTCDSIHFIEDMRRSARRGVSAVAASSGAIQRVGAACGLTSLVTAIGFASLSAARIDAVRSFGMAAAAGAVASFLAVTLLTPLLASTSFFSGMRLGRSSRRAGRLANALTAFSVRYSRPIVAVGCAATLLLGLIGSRLDADNHVIDSLPRNAAASQALIGVDRDFGGVMGFDIVVQWPDGLNWLDPSVIDALDEVHAAIERSGSTSRAISLATVAATLPDRAQQRLDAADFRDMVDPTAHMAIVRARVTDVGSRALEGVYGRIDGELATLAAARPGWAFQLTGMSVVSARNIRQLIRDLGSSLLLEVAVIGLILSLAFRSPLAGIVSLIPNIFPLTVVAAALVATGRSLDPATVIVFNVCLGLAVDDTVHVLSAVRRQRREGVSIRSAVRRAVAETGNAVVIGGLVLAVGFAVVMASSVPSLSGFGMLACAAVAAATVAELVLLPALLVVTDAFVRRWLVVRRDGIFGPAPITSPGHAVL